MPITSEKEKKKRRQLLCCPKLYKAGTAKVKYLLDGNGKLFNYKNV